MSHWLCKSEPETYSFSTLLKEKTTNWNDVRNYQARNFLRQMKKGDSVLIYHSGDDKAVVGVAQVIKEAYPDHDPDGGDWVQVDLKAVQALKKPITLSAIKTDPKLSKLPLIKQSRLSVMPIAAAEFSHIVKLGGI